MNSERDHRLDSARGESGNVFPLAMTSMEKFHWLDDSPEYPNLIFARLRFDTTIDPQHAQTAWETAVGRHPLGQASPEKQKNWVWQINGETPRESTPFFRHQDLGAPPVGWEAETRCPDQPVRPGLTLLRWPVTEPALARTPPGFHGEARFHVHHAIADGVGSLQVINEWLTIYNNLCRDLPPMTGLRSLDVSRLAQRNHLGLTSWRYLRHLPKQPVALFGAAKFIFRKSVTLASSQAAGTRETNLNFPAVVGRWLSPETTSAIYDQAARHSVSANSILLGGLFAALHQWRISTGQATSGNGDWIRIILPINLRTHADRRLPATNRTSIVQLDRQAPVPGKRVSFFRMLDREIRIIRNWQLDKMFLIFIRGLSVSETSLQRAAANPKSRGMAVFTDLGRPFQSSWKRLQRQRPSEESASTPALWPVDFDLVGPIRTGTPINLSASRMNGQLKISLHYDGRLLSQAQAESLFSLFENQLNEIQAELEH